MTLACTVPLELPGLTPSSRRADVSVDWIGATEPPAESGTPSQLIVEPSGGWLAVSDAGGATRLRFGYADDHVQFDVAPDATRVVVTCTPEVLPAHACTLLSTTVMGYLLHRHGRLALHAGVVARGGAAFAFAGAPGAGKSTTIGVLNQRGCAVLSDDVAALSRAAGGWAVSPGPAGIRLAPEALAALAVPPSLAVPVWPRSPHLSDKAVVSVDDAPVSRGTLRLAGIFVLPPRRDDVTSVRITAPSPAAAVPCLAAHLSTPAWLQRTVDETRFRMLADLAACTPVRIVERPDSLAALPELGHVLLDEMERLRP